MSKAKDTATAGSANVSSRKPRKTEAAFDLWLQKGLHEIYDRVAKEPVPDELMQLIEKDRQR